MLLTPPFDKTSHDPGYIKGYLPGVRENGDNTLMQPSGVLWAYASLGQGEPRSSALSFAEPRLSFRYGQKKWSAIKPSLTNIAADIYSVFPHIGNGGWTGYTGFRRLDDTVWGMEAILGVSRVGNTLKINPCIPKDLAQL